MRHRTVTLAALIALGALVNCLAPAITPALANLGFEFKRTLNDEHTPFFEGSAGSLAVDHRTDNLFVSTSNRSLETDEQVEVIRADSGEYVTTLTGAETPAHSFGNFANVVAVDENTGYLYVADLSDRVVDVIELKEEIQGGKTVVSEVYLRQLTPASAPGSWERPEGLTVDPTNGDLYVLARLLPEGAFEQRVIDIFSASGVFKSQITESGLGTRSARSILFHRSLTVDDSTSDVLVSGAEVVYVLNTAGELLTTWNGAHTPNFSFGPAPNETSLVLASDATGYTFVANAGQHLVDVFDPSDAKAETFSGRIASSPSHPFADLRAITIDQLSGEEYLIDEVAPRQDVIDVFSAPFKLPTATAGLPASVQSTGAVLNGTVDPEGKAVTTCAFEYGLSASYGQSLPCSPANLGEGTSPIPVSASLTGALPGTVYHYRITAGNGGGSESSADRHLITAPQLGGESASTVSQFSATLHASIEPGVVPTTYHFVYGPTAAYGSVAPIPDVALAMARGEHAISQELTGLQAGTTYHFAVVASSASGTYTSPDATFTTPPIPMPVVNTGGASNPTVAEATLSGTIDPQGWNTRYHFEYGTTTSYGSNWPTVDVDLGGLNGSQPVTVTVQNLLPGTTYHYRLVASNGGGVAFGADEVFATAQYPQSVIQPVPVLGVLRLPSTERPRAKTKVKAKHKKKKTKADIRRSVGNRHRGRGARRHKR